VGQVRSEAPPHGHTGVSRRDELEHGKTDGNHLEMRITELTLNGGAISPRPACAALQSSGPADPP
jgi:hypothetical protein